MNKDNDLKRMFEAQRQVDESLAPSFDDIAATTQAARKVAPPFSYLKAMSWPVGIALSVVALLGVVNLAHWTNAPRPGEPAVSSTLPADLQKLNLVCDSLLVRINELDDSQQLSKGTVEKEMDWPTGTDSLIPFETFSFNVRTLP